jgi:hypothetical protein
VVVEVVCCAGAPACAKAALDMASAINPLTPFSLYCMRFAPYLIELGTERNREDGDARSSASRVR